MKRREILKILGISAVGLAAVPWWIDSWNEDDIPNRDFGIKEDQLVLLQGLIDTIIPETDIPGAKQLQVDKFVVTMVADCYEKPIQEEFLGGFNEIEAFSNDKFGGGFMDITQKQRISLLKEFSERPKTEEREINFVTFLKDLTVLGFTSSEYVQMNHLDYEMVPARFNGSMPV